MEMYMWDFNIAGAFRLMVRSLPFILLGFKHQVQRLI
jgi:hypothetical protein